MSNEIDSAVCRILEAFSKEEISGEMVKTEERPETIYPDVKYPEGFYIKIQRTGHSAFYSWFVPAKQEGRPLIVMMPGYHAFIYQMPDVSEKYNFLFASPLGYVTPQGRDYSKFEHGVRPVMYNTIHGREDGYEQWVLDVLAAVKWVDGEYGLDGVPVITAGTSQGGGMSLVLGSIMKPRTAAICADEPWLIGFSGERIEGIVNQNCYGMEIVRMSQVEKNLFPFDPVRHTERLTMPVLVTASDADNDCPAVYIEKMFANIPEPKRLVKYTNRPHGYDISFFNKMLDFLGENNI